jgi:hypothetical protein
LARGFARVFINPKSGEVTSPDWDKKGVKPRKLNRLQEKKLLQSLAEDLSPTKNGGSKE